MQNLDGHFVSLIYTLSYMFRKSTSKIFACNGLNIYIGIDYV